MECENAVLVSSRCLVIGGSPAPGSRACLAELAQNYLPVYLETRSGPGPATPDRRLRDFGFPPGEVLPAPVEAERIRELSEKYRFAFGIGGGWDDNELHLALGCRSIILDERQPNWDTVRKFCLPAPTAQADLRGLLAFLRESELLKSTLRTAWTSSGRRESTAEHSWRLALFSALLLEYFPGLDARKTLTMCLVHDLGELYDGDISAATLPDEEVKHQMEARAVERVLSLLPPGPREELQSLWREYNENKSAEARLVKALDKAETILQHNQGKNPPDFDYAFNLRYGKPYFETSPLLRTLRALLDQETQAHR